MNNEMNAPALTLSTDLSTMDWPRITAWLAGSYWSPGISQHYVEQAARASTVVIGAFVDGQQVGYARVISDTVRFAYLADVYVDEAYRGGGISKKIISELLSSPILAGVSRCFLLTGNAHGLYEQFGFQVFPAPERMMVRENPSGIDFTQTPI
ncbi:GNAT family N-acetyltransferase [Chitinibacter bivalviorum]|uniref:GNAT family N-acetyltransferase n=1 Tax=Chitinibacter bivalviorum TaxID=2739434 RepID=A0A7H9BKX7_9NEIS|nr:GNAT family N-acetyltransferase [Chitinibacter bivalviorum]QLG89159.1 GNAT family N-acetyltransferase [Chitinibacter bivalviorum]